MDPDRYLHGEGSGDDDMLAVLRSIDTTPNQEAEQSTLDVRLAVGDATTSVNTTADEHVWGQATPVAGSTVPPPPSAAQYVNIFDDQDESSADLSERLRAGSMSEDEEIAALVAMLDVPSADDQPASMHASVPGSMEESMDRVAERAVALVAERLAVVEHHDDAVFVPSANGSDPATRDQMQLDQALLDQALLDQAARPNASTAWQSPPPPPPPVAPHHFENGQREPAVPAPPVAAISDPDPAVAVPLYVAEPVTHVAAEPAAYEPAPAPVWAPEPEPIADPQWAVAAEPQYLEPQHIEPRHIEPRHIEPRHIEPQHVEPPALEQHDIEPVRAEPAHTEPVHAEPVPAEPAHAEPAPVAVAPAAPPPVVTAAPVAPPTAAAVPAPAPAFDPVAPLRQLLAELDLAGTSSAGGPSADTVAARDLLDEMAYLIASAPADIEAERQRRWGAVVEARLVYKQLLEGATPQRMQSVTPAELAEAEILLRDLLDAEGKARRSMSGPKAFKKFGLARRRLDAYLETYGVETIDELRELALAGPTPVGPVTLADAGNLVAAAEQAWQSVGDVEVGGLPQGIEADGFRLRCYRFIGSVVDDAVLESELRRRAEAPDEAGIIAGRLADAIRDLGMPVGDDPIATARTLVGMLGRA